MSTTYPTDRDAQRRASTDPETHSVVLAAMVDDPNIDMSIKRDVAMNPSTPWYSLDKLAHTKDRDNSIQRYVAKNPTASKETLRYLWDNYNEVGLLRELFVNPSTPEDIKWQLSFFIPGAKVELPKDLYYKALEYIEREMC